MHNGENVEENDKKVFMVLGQIMIPLATIICITPVPHSYYTNHN